jgi:hypothetical protein
MSRAVALLARLFGLAAPGEPGAGATLLIFAAGAALASSWTLPEIGWTGVAGTTALLTAAAWACTSAAPRWRVVSAAVLLLAHGFWIALAAVFAGVLTWAVPPWIWIVDGVAALLAIAGVVHRPPPVRVPIALPLGIAIAALIGGWMWEDGLIHCDDYLRVRAAGATVVVPSTPELARCLPGETLLVERYPRQLWEAPEGDAFVITTQRADHDFSPPRRPARPVPPWLDGAICRVQLAPPAPPQCLAGGKADAIAESERYDRLYVPTHEQQTTTIYALPRHGALRPLATAQVPVKGAIVYFDDEKDVMGLCEDEGAVVYRLRPSDLTVLGPLPAPVLSDQMRYDPIRHEGILCGAGSPLHGIDGEGFIAAAFTAEPFALRPLAPTSRYPSSLLAGTWGCDFDPATRRAWIALASNGLLVEVDYDSGDVIRRSWIGLGIRSVVYDPRRHLVYAGFFLSGDIVAVAPDTGAVVARWPSGRFVRSLTLARDGDALLVTSNLGVVRIPLITLPRRAADGRPEHRRLAG